MAYLMEDGKLIGRLPELSISGDFFRMLGKDYIGTVFGGPQRDIVMSAVFMDVGKS